MIRGIRKTSTFEKQFKKYQHTDETVKRLKKFSKELLQWQLDPKRKNHKLWGLYSWYYEAHLFPDVLVIYQIVDERCVFTKIGSHSDLFG
jgi:mRNA interferase YafQ